MKIYIELLWKAIVVIVLGIVFSGYLLGVNYYGQNMFITSISIVLFLSSIVYLIDCKRNKADIAKVFIGNLIIYNLMAIVVVSIMAFGLAIEHAGNTGRSQSFGDVTTNFIYFFKYTIPVSFGLSGVISFIYWLLTKCKLRQK